MLPLAYEKEACLLQHLPLRQSIDLEGTNLDFGLTQNEHIFTTQKGEFRKVLFKLWLQRTSLEKKNSRAALLRALFFKV